MATRRGVGHRLVRAFVIQAVFISLTALLGVLAARFVLQDVLIRKALEDEAGYYLQQLTTSPGAPLPQTVNLRSYRVPDERSVPPHLRELGPGYHPLTDAADGFSAVYVAESDGDRLLFEFKGERVSDLTFYFGLVPLAIVLVIIYSATWIAYRLSQQAVSPLVRLAQQVATLDPLGPSSEIAIDDASDLEVRVLTQALAQYTDRIQSFVERERAFTRDASHELRTPITVIRLAASALLAEDTLPPRTLKQVRQIESAAGDMAELVDVFLLLAREADQALTPDPVDVEHVLSTEIERARPILEGKPVRVAYTCSSVPDLFVPERVLSILVSNLVRNAFLYTARGVVSVDLAGDALTIEDSGVGISEAEVSSLLKPFQRGTGRGDAEGWGVGLTIVKRLVDGFGWTLTLNRRPGGGTRACVRFQPPEPAS